MGHGTALIEQDYIRRTLLQEKDLPNQPNIELIALNVRYALAHNYHVILEGILDRERYGDMLEEVMNSHKGPSYVYYFNVSFEETLKRHATNPNAREFGETEMRKWFKPQDLLGIDGEGVIEEGATLEQTTTRILHNLTLSET